MKEYISTEGFIGYVLVHHTMLGGRPAVSPPETFKNFDDARRVMMENAATRIKNAGTHVASVNDKFKDFIYIEYNDGDFDDFIIFDTSVVNEHD